MGTRITESQNKIENGQQKSKAYFVKHGVGDIFLGKECDQP